MPIQVYTLHGTVFVIIKDNKIEVENFVSTVCPLQV